MRFALFYEIPVARPWDPDAEHRAYKNTLEQAILGDKVGFHSVWTVEHHFLEEYSHCSNPEILYGAIAARTEHIRIGYGVRLLPAALQPPDPHRGVGRGARPPERRPGRVRHRPVLDARRAEGFDVNPHETRAMWSEALRHIVGAWTEDEYQADGKYWRMGGPRRVQPKPLQQPHPPIWGATSQPRRPPRDRAPRHRPLLVHRRRPARRAGRAPRPVPRRAWPSAPQPAGKFVNDQAATFTMVHCASSKRGRLRDCRRVVRLVREARRRGSSARSPSCSKAATSARTSTRPCRSSRTAAAWWST